MTLPDRLKRRILEFARGSGNVTFLTGAGISAESGIPTFRGPDGYWVVGSRNYMPEEMATRSMFLRNPREVWRWYLYRFGVCRKAEPNPGHLAIARIERFFQDRFRLITQNIDGLHLRAGSSLERTYQIHGSIERIRCSAGCSEELSKLPKFGDREKDDPIREEEWRMLTCTRCGSPMRPHVLWFDECYDEEHYKLESSLAAALHTEILFVVGTSGSTNLPHQVVRLVFENGGSVIDINPERNPFSPYAEESGGGAYVSGKSGEVLPEIERIIQDASR